MAPRRPSMNDVASQAGVSYQTVSRVLNAPHLVKDSTRERVEAAIAKLGYTRNQAARTLRTTHSSIIGVVTDGSPLFGPAATLGAVEQAANADGFATLLTSVTSRGSSTRVDDQLIEMGVDGIIVIAPHVGMVAPLREVVGRVPVVAIAAEYFDIEGVSSVAVDQARGAYDAMTHLRDQGASTILHLQGPSSWFDARARVHGVEQAAKDLGLSVTVSPALGWAAEAGYEYVRAIDPSDLPDSIFAANDLLALGALRALNEQHIPVPDGVKVMGFDDIGGAEYFSPSLSTVRQPFSHLGRQAVEVLLSLIQGVETPRATYLDPEVIVRGSTAAE